MILPIYLLGTDTLRTETQDVQASSESIQALIDDMIETMHAAAGIGLAAPQVGRRERLFVVDLSAMDEEQSGEGIEIPEQPIVFINPIIAAESEEDAVFEEGCLSIPDIHEEVTRPVSILIRYLDRKFQSREHRFSGMFARVIQHEFDHLEGVLFVDLISPFRRRLLKRRLKDIRDGEIDSDYPVFVSGKGVLFPEKSG